MIKEILSSWFSRVGAALPTWLLGTLIKRWYGPDQIARHVIVELRSGAPGSIDLGPSPPCIDLWLQLTNLSLVTVRIAWFKLDVRVGQPVGSGYEPEPVTLNPRSRLARPVKLAVPLHDSHVRSLSREYHSGRVRQAEVHLTVAIHTDLGTATIKRTLLWNDVALVGQLSQPVATAS